MLQPILTERLILRTLEASDAEAVYAYQADPEVCRYQNSPFSSTDSVRTFLARQHGREPFTSAEWFQLGLTLRDTGEVVGDCGLHARDNDRRQVEIGITLSRPFQRRGLGSEALSALLAFLFHQPDTHRVFCSVNPRNRPCIKLLERFRMRREAHMLESLWINNEWVDDVVFAMLRREWRGPMRNKASN